MSNYKWLYDKYPIEHFIFEEDDGEGNVRASIVLPQDSDNSNADRAQVLMRMAHIGFITLASSANTDGNRYIEVIEGK